MRLWVVFPVACFYGVSTAQDFPAESFRRVVPELPSDSRQKQPESQQQEPDKATGELSLPSPPPPEKDRLSGKVEVEVNSIKVTGNKAFSEKQLRKVTKPFEGRLISSEDLFKLRNELTYHYANSGFINSGAVIPDQEVVDGIIEIKIIEGQLTNINVAGNDRLRERYITSRLRLGNEDILNVNRLQEQIRLLHDDRLIQRINAVLNPGERRGEGILEVKIKESRPYDLVVSFNNYRSPSVDEYQGEVYASLYNVTGFGDSLKTNYSITEGLDNIFASYSLPLSAYDTRIGVHYEKTDADIIENPFDVLNIESETESYGANLSHPLYKTLQRRLLGELIVEKRRSKSTFQLSGFQREPFVFAGVKDGRSDVTVLRFRLDWVDRELNQVLAMRSTLSWGIDASKLLDPETNTVINDDEYFTWLGQLQFLRRVGDTDVQVLIRGDLQLASEPLLPLERFNVGGARSVRGYRENQFVRDKGAVASIELRYPIFRLPIPGVSASHTDGTVQLAGFYDFGWSDNKDQVAFSPKSISSAGIGVRWDPHRKIQTELYWGIPFRNIDTGGESSLQDSGVHFSLSVGLF